MGCQSDVPLNDNLTFSICTHDADTGALTVADAAPAYRIYEDETSTAIATGTMAALDAANTTGFYSERISCTAANGFERGKTYSIYITAAVDGDTGGIAFGFVVLAGPVPARRIIIIVADSRTLTPEETSGGNPGLGGMFGDMFGVMGGNPPDERAATITARTRRVTIL